MLNWFCII